MITFQHLYVSFWKIIIIVIIPFFYIQWCSGLSPPGMCVGITPAGFEGSYVMSD